MYVTGNFIFVINILYSFHLYLGSISMSILNMCCFRRHCLFGPEQNTHCKDEVLSHAVPRIMQVTEASGRKPERGHLTSN